MVAQRFAEYSGLEYAIMSGGDVAPLGDQGVTELHKLFKWVHRSKRGVLLFIDEADAFLASRKGANMSEALRNGLTTMLYHTGTPSSQFIMVLATNRPGDLDQAVLDRIDESVEFGLPELEARKGMVNQYFNMYITKPLSIKVLGPKDDPRLQVIKKGVFALMKKKEAELTASSKACPKETREQFVDETALASAARRLNGFSGREISKLMMSLQTHILYSLKGEEVRFLEKKIMFQVIDSKVLEHERTADFQVSGYDYVHNERQGTPIVGTPIITPNGTYTVPKLMRREPPPPSDVIRESECDFESTLKKVGKENSPPESGTGA
jgi:ATPase family AAA domain-containing protein 3A/B